ncbi:MAG: ABC transporter permease [Candidatus Methanoplasma sp.]|jgi:ABC-2 type transport system permease protein|nr:ABC transporter permease [Candidatus Methanoplasma sp.]
MMYVELDDFRQSYVVAKNEIRKFIRGKKFALYVGIVVAVFALMTFLPYVFGDNLGNTSGEVLSGYVSFISFLAILAATLFSSVIIVSEFEERTALILFTRPIKKTSIFIGKFLGCFALEAIVVVGFYAAVTLVSYIAPAERFIPSGLLTSLGFALLFMFAASAVAVFLSTVMKKGSSSAIMTFIVLLLILPVISMILGSAGGFDTWFMLDQVSDAISNSVPEYVDISNANIDAMADRFDIPADMIDRMKVHAPDVLKTTASALAWGIVALVLSWVAFIRKEF